MLIFFAGWLLGAWASMLLADAAGLSVPYWLALLVSLPGAVVGDRLAARWWRRHIRNRGGSRG